MRKFLSAALMAAFCSVVGLGSVSDTKAQTIAPDPKQTAHLQLRSYYRNSDVRRITALLSELDKSNQSDWTTHPPMMGFMAGLLVKNPNLPDLLPPDASRLLYVDLAVAFSLAGQQERGLSLARQKGMSGETISFIQSTPSLKALKVRNPTELDYLWGAAFATGNPLYVRPIVKRFVQLVDQPEKAADVLAMSEFMRTG